MIKTESALLVELYTLKRSTTLLTKFRQLFSLCLIESILVHLLLVLLKVVLLFVDSVTQCFDIRVVVKLVLFDSFHDLKSTDVVLHVN